MVIDQEETRTIRKKFCHLKGKRPEKAKSPEDPPAASPADSIGGEPLQPLRTERVKGINMRDTSEEELQLGKCLSEPGIGSLETYKVGYLLLLSPNRCVCSEKSKN